MTEPSFDPCGTRHIDGEEIIKRLAKELDVNPANLRVALLILVQHYEENEE